MRKVLVLALLALLVATPAFAQAPAPTTKVTITGLVDTMTTWSQNISTYDNNLEKGDSEWTARNRFRPDITAELGTTKMVIGLEIDSAFGATGAGGSDTAATQKFGTTGSFDLGTDRAAALELKWAYAEFGLPGIPWSSRLRLGAQPWAQTYKGGVLATGDFGGAHLTMTIAPPIKLNLTYAQIEEEVTGAGDGFNNGEDFALVGSVEITPVKGIDIRPILAWMRAEGTTSGASRLGRGGVSNAAAFFSRSSVENRWTIGADARISMGPITIDPTFLFQFGERELISQDQDIRTWLADVRGGFRTGPLLLEAAAIWTPGNRAEDDIRNAGADLRAYQVISADSGFYGGWAEHFALNTDYFMALREAGGTACSCNSIGYDKYGLLRFGARASYAVTPAFAPRVAVTTQWTSEEVDTDGAFAVATGLTPSAGATRAGDHRYLGTEVDLGFQWKFAPGVALDAVYAYSFIGPAWASATAAGVVTSSNNNPNNVQSAVVRLRYSF